MQITRFTDYSLRLLVLLVQQPGRAVTVREVAEYYSLSSDHLKKIVRRLVELGHIRTVRGKNGGIMLARRPEEINLGQLFRAEENLALMPCHDGRDSCPVDPCRMRAIIDDALDAFMGVLDQRTLADLVL